MIDLQKLKKTKDSSSIKKAAELIQNIGVPSNPQIVVDIDNEMKKIRVDFKTIADLVEKDVSLSAKVLKIANSPFFSTRKSETIEQALLVLGMTNFYNIIITAALREALDKYSTNRAFNDRFLKHSCMVAQTARFVAKRIKSPIIEMAYLVGLFHDCAVPLFMKRYQDAKEWATLHSQPMAVLSLDINDLLDLREDAFEQLDCAQ